MVDPIETIEKFGTDALRLSLVTGVTPGMDVPLSMEKVEANRNFANKLWNTGRFIVMGLEGLPAAERDALAVSGPMSADEIRAMPLAERWIISRCHSLVDTVSSFASPGDRAWPQRRDAATPRGLVCQPARPLHPAAPFLPVLAASGHLPRWPLAIDR